MSFGRAAAALLSALVLAGCGASSDVEAADAPARTSPSETNLITTTGGSTTLPGAPTTVGRPTSTDASSRTTLGDVHLQTLTASGNGAAYTMGVPESWSAIDPTVGTPEDVAAKIAELFPNGADPAALAAAIRQGLVLFAIDPLSGSNVNVLVQDQTVSLDLLAGQIDQQLASVGAAPANLSRPTIAGREALRADTTIATPSARLTQLYVVTDTQTYVTTITTPSATKGVPIDAMAASIAIT